MGKCSSRTRVRLKMGPVRLSYDGEPALLRTDVLALAHELDRLQVAKIGPSAHALVSLGKDARKAHAGLADVMEQLGHGVSELTTEDQLRLQMIMDRMNRAMEMLSNLMKKMHETSATIVANMK